MSRSRFKTPVCGITKAESEKKDKRICNRGVRRNNRITIAVKDIDDLEVVTMETQESFMDIWSMDKDGKIRYDPKKYPKYMRK